MPTTTGYPQPRSATPSSIVRSAVAMRSRLSSGSSRPSESETVGSRYVLEPLSDDTTLPFPISALLLRRPVNVVGRKPRVKHDGVQSKAGARVKDGSPMLSFATLRRTTKRYVLPSSAMMRSATRSSGVNPTSAPRASKRAINTTARAVPGRTLRDLPSRIQRFLR